MPSIRPAGLHDAAFLAEGLIGIARGLREASSNPYAAFFPEAASPREFEYALGFIRDPEKRAWVSTEEEKPAGFLLAEMAPSALTALGIGPAGQVAACWVEPGFRGRGIARALVREAEAWFRERGARFAELTYAIENSDAAEAWKKLGYASFRAFANKDLGGPAT